MKPILIYPLAALAEIGGCFAFWAWLKLDRSPLWLAPGVACLIVFMFFNDWQLAMVVLLGVPLVAADTDEQAEYLATSVYQRILALMRGQSLMQKPPVDSMNGLWLPHEREAVGDFLGLAMIGSPQKVKAKIEVLLEQTGADELIFTCDLYEHADRVRSYELLAQTVLGS